MHLGRALRIGLVAAFAIAIAASPFTEALHGKGKKWPPATPQLAFSAPQAIDRDHRTGEPGIDVDPLGRAIYVSAPSGLLSGHQGWFWRSTDGGASWEFVEDVAGLRLGTQVGGGDSDVVATPNGRLYYADLWLGDISVSRSDDLGRTWLVGNPAASDVPANDRQWLDVYGEDLVFLAYNQIPYGPTVSVSRDGGLTWITAPAIGVDQTTGYIGNVVVDQATGDVRVLYQVCAPTCSNELWVTTSRDGGLTWTQTRVHHSERGNVANLFASMAQDRAGNLYVTWSEQLYAGGPTQVFVASSTDRGATWSAPSLVTASLGNGVMPWIVAGTDGRVDVVAYGSSYGGDAATAPSSATWYVYLAQSVNAHNATPTWTLAIASSSPNHYGSICNKGLDCDTSVPTGDRSLLDFFQVALDPQGYANIIYADNHAVDITCDPRCDPFVTFVKQNAGVSLYG
jgi:hypothetical protein